MNLFKASLILTTFAIASTSFAQNPKSSDAGPGGTAGGGTNISSTGINTGNLGTSSIGTTTNMTRGNTSGEGPSLAPNGHSTNQYRASSTAGLDQSTSTSNSARPAQQAQKKRLNSSPTTAAPSPGVLKP